MLCFFLSIYSILAASWRVHNGLHTGAQTLVGAAVGTSVGYFFHKKKRVVSNFLRIGTPNSLLRFFNNKYVMMNLLILAGAAILYGPELKDAILGNRSKESAVTANSELWSSWWSSCCLKRRRTELWMTIMLKTTYKSLDVWKKMRLRKKKMHFLQVLFVKNASSFF